MDEHRLSSWYDISLPLLLLTLLFWLRIERAVIFLFSNHENQVVRCLSYLLLGAAAHVALLGNRKVKDVQPEKLQRILLGSSVNQLLTWFEDMSNPYAFESMQFFGTKSFFTSYILTFFLLFLLLWFFRSPPFFFPSSYALILVTLCLTIRSCFTC